MSPLEDEDAKDRRGRFQDDDEGVDGAAPGWGPKALFFLLQTYIQQHRTRFAIATSAMLAAGFFFFVAWAVVVIVEARRPTLEMAIDALDHGAYGQARNDAKSVLKYAAENETEKRGGALYVYGVATCEGIEGVRLEDKTPVYREAADALAESRELGFLTDRPTEGYFYLGKARYFCHDYPEAIKNFEIALEKDSPRAKTINWYLANAYFRSPRPDYVKGLEALDRFEAVPPFLPRERQEATLLRTFLNLRLGRLEAAKASYGNLAPLTEPGTMIRGELAAGKICMQEAELFRRYANDLEAAPQLSVTQEEQDRLNEQLQETPLREVSENIIPRGMPASPFLQRLESPRTSPSPGDRIKAGFQEDDVVEAPRIRADDPSGPSHEPVLEPVEQRRVITSKDIVIDTWRRLVTQKLEDAIAHFETVRRNDTELLDLYRQAAFLEAMCLEKLGDYDRAQEEFHSLARTFPGTSEAIAAQFRWGYIEHNIKHRPITGYASLLRFFNMLSQHDSYDNSWMSLDDIAEVGVEEVLKLARQRRYGDAAEMFEYFLSIVPEERQARVFTLIYRQWGEQLEDSAVGKKLDEQHELIRQAREKFRLAGRWYEELAKWTFDSSEYLNNVWTAAEYYERGRDFPKAMAMYRLYLEYDIVFRQAQSHYHIGSILFEMNEIDAAVKELEYCIESFPDDPLIEQVRLVLTYAVEEKHEWDYAARLLKMNLDGKYAPNSDVYRQSLYELGRVYAQKRNSAETISVFEDVLGLYPDDPKAAEAHYMIARANLDYETELETQMEQAQLQSQKDIIRQTLVGTRQQALTRLQQARTLLIRKEEQNGIDAAEQRMLRNTFFMIGRLLTAMGPEYYEEANRENKAAVARYFAHPDVLQAYLQLARVYQLQGRPEQSAKVIHQAENLFKRFQATGAFRDETVYNESQWQELLGTR